MSLPKRKKSWSSGEQAEECRDGRMEKEHKEKQKYKQQRTITVERIE